MGTHTWIFEQEGSAELTLGSGSMAHAQGGAGDETLSANPGQTNKPQEQQLFEVEEMLNNASWYSSDDSEDESRVGSIVVVDCTMHGEEEQARHEAGDKHRQQTATKAGEWMEAVLNEPGDDVLDSSERHSVQSEWIIKEVKKNYYLIDNE